MLHRRDELEDQILGYDERIRINLQDSEAYWERGNAYQSLGDYGGAVEDYSEVIRLGGLPVAADIGLWAVYLSRAVAYVRLGRHDLANQDLDEAGGKGSFADMRRFFDDIRHGLV